MTKTQLIEHIVRNTELTKLDATRALDAALDGIKRTLMAGGSVTLAGFGSFSVSQYGTRIGRNPRTGEKVVIEPFKRPKFLAGQNLKEAVNE